MRQAGWEFWIDVGGTFTDCFAQRPDGALTRHKLLSSGVTKGAAAVGSTSSRIVDHARAGDPAGFWTGNTLRLLDAGGTILGESRVAAFDALSATLTLSTSLPLSPSKGQPYELVSGEEAPIIAIRYMLGLSLDAEIPPVVVRLGTTRGTNALITRTGARTALVTTRGFADVLRIGYQNRPKLFELAIKKREPLAAAVVEIDERVTVAGDILRQPDADTVRRQLLALKQSGIESLAICLLHAYKHAEHEQFVADIAENIGFRDISASSRVAPLVKIVVRGDTTVMDAYLNPILRDYVAGLRAALRGSDVRIMTSAGGLVAADRFVGKDSILSGPAGGVVGFSRVAQAAGFTHAIGFDMGGTSTDVSRFDGRYEVEYETEKSGVRVVAPMMAIETVAAGGGSICAFDGAKLIVGPQSAGAQPGPACYGRGGPLAVTDVNYYLGKILPEHFPFPLDRAAVETRIGELIEAIDRATGTRYAPVELCDGFLRVANANMVKAIQSISIAKGCDPRDYVLVAFGGAAGQHACSVADELGIRQVLLHPDAGILSAYGIGVADVVRHAARGIYREYSEDAVAQISSAFDELAAPAEREVIAEGVPPGRIEIRRALDLRYQGLDAWLTIPEPETGTYAEAYATAHEKLYGYRHEEHGLDIVAARVEVIGRSLEPEPPSRRLSPRDAVPERAAIVYFDAAPCAAGVFDRAALRPGNRIVGPAIVHEGMSTTVIDRGWSGEVLSRGELLLTAVVDTGGTARLPSSAAPHTAAATNCDPATLEVFNNRFAAIAEQMGITLRNTASSVNVKERLDFSCAVFTAGGDLVVNAPHIPVHLGAMGETVRCILADNPTMQVGDVFVSNDPYRGGSHLPDVTVVTPIFDTARSRLLFFTASRAHHAEIGGIVPGSMPPASKNLAEEGVLIQNFKLVDAGRSRAGELRELLLSAPYPTRKVADNMADIAAQVAANQQGARDLARLAERYTLPVVAAYMGHIQAAAERKMRMALGRLADGRREFVDHLDDGSPIAVAIDIAGDEATIEFSGTGPVLAGNLNANRAIVTAAVMYVLRCLIDEDIPLNQGVLAPVRIVLPECLLNPTPGRAPETSPAIAGGNVETSQRVVDVLLGALGRAAASQGTMNNLLFGDSTFGYYETICGGAGATAVADGADAVHTHMTNTRLTDPEVLEQRYPVRLLEFAIRRGSGGAGARRGGDGVVRRIEFLRPLDVSILSQRRGPYAPYGMAGGEPGALGPFTDSSLPAAHRRESGTGTETQRWSERTCAVYARSQSHFPASPF
ncbi:MAG: hydantoinase B/oxoprolinase family protein [Planctomycetia bacterium]|nr:hydantoinase B/oxoprolinase family protein [Planctomycetia bacterium]